MSETFIRILREMWIFAEERTEKVEIQDEVTDEICDVCGRNMVIKYGPTWKIPCMSWIPGMQKYQTVL